MSTVQFEKSKQKIKKKRKMITPKGHVILFTFLSHIFVRLLELVFRQHV